MQYPPMSLYVHIPWCEKKCPYCDFNSYASSNIPEQDYLDCLIADLEIEAESVQDRELKSIFFGGGTPSLFSAESLARLLQTVAKRFHFNRDIEITLEVNPASADQKKFLDFFHGGINRLSIGVQSFNDLSLRDLGRIHTSRDGASAIKLAQTAGFSNINIDLMYGLPNQTEEEAVSDLNEAILWRPQHVSWYELTIEPNTMFYSNPPILPKENTLEAIQEAGLSFLSKNGFSRYEISAFSKLNHQCKHNLNYWRFGDYLGIGAGAHGKITNKDSSITRYSKTRNPVDYLSASPCEARVNESTLSKKETVLDFVLNSFRLTDGFTLDQ
ncbi:MAG: radical SAM family heme chaperone HemW, partial [Halieaceae bacterium]|nr:radical SAM family heme chaperone HemW [Halieaceae bacterium]